MSRHLRRWSRRGVPIACALALAVLGLSTATGSGNRDANTALDPNFVVLAYNDLGMHCMNADFSEAVVLPPYNNFRAQVLRRGSSPQPIEQGISVQYFLPSNTHAADKTNFWTFAPLLFGVNLPADVGLAGKGLRGTMDYAGRGQWEAIGVPLVPIDDNGQFNAYPLATVRVVANGNEIARTQAVMPVSTELSCNLCHNTPGISPETDLLRAHDRLHNTNLEQSKPVLCASCHADNALGTPGTPGVPNLSSAMHSAHATRMAQAGLTNVCYACHPGIRTSCQRDVHFANGINCSDCHGDMATVGNPARNPWVDEPRCGDCHVRQGFQFEEAGRLFKDSRGHGNIHCATCHSSPHAITPAVTQVDNVQANRVQGHPGVINGCTVCHTRMPGDPFPHRRDD